MLVTRPSGQAEPLCRLIEAAGGRAIRLPLLAVAPAKPSAATRAALDGSLAYDVMVFVSRNAVRYGVPVLRPLLGGMVHCAVIGVGPATFEALAEAGLMPVRVPPATEASSEGLLGLGIFTAPQIVGKQVLIVRGVGGRDTLAATLRQRGAQVRYAEVYRRTPREIDLAAALADGEPPQVSLITSVEGLEHFAKLIRAQGRSGFLAMPLAALSRRIAQRAEQMGFSGAVAVAAQASDAGLLDALVSLRQQGACP